MGLASVYSRAAVGLAAPLVTVEVNLSPGLPRFSIVGLPETAVRESRDRVKAAIVNSGFEFPQWAITAHLGPADLPKHGGRYDLAIALGILAASAQVPGDALAPYEFLGELGLSGSLRGVRAVLPAALETAAAGRSLIVATDNAAEAALSSQLTVLPATRLLDVAGHFRDAPLAALDDDMPRQVASDGGPDLADLGGQPRARRALEIAAAGGHNLLLVGPPGGGKSLLARCLPGVLPLLTESEALEHAAVESLSGAGVDVRRFRQRPFRAPHHTASAAALVGGGAEPRPGEASRAHLGVLFLDELAEFPRHVLEALREPLEVGHLTISRAAGQIDFPADVMLVAAMNPCPCGYAGDTDVDCRCTPDQIGRYRGRLSGPLLDRIDLNVEMPRVTYQELSGARGRAESSAAVAARVAAARERQLARQPQLNASLPQALRSRHCRLDDAGHRLLDRAMDEYALSARAVERTLKVARSIADLVATKAVEAVHLAEALTFREAARRKRC
ncbi:MAG: YifB family Mg chelatase-like AAA ATPase [Pseudomonadota bacterium]